MTAPAPLVLVVGPSGAGKDSLIAGAKAALADDRGILFARRVVTRPALAEAEDHDSLTPEQFAEAELRGEFLLSWQAHGLGYGLPTVLQAQRRNGVTVVANVSRGVVDHARATLRPVSILVVTASADTLVRRLAARGRESEAEIFARIRRSDAVAMPNGSDVRMIVNDGPLADGVAEFLRHLAEIRNAVFSPV